MIGSMIQLISSANQSFAKNMSINSNGSSVYSIFSSLFARIIETEEEKILKSMIFFINMRIINPGQVILLTNILNHDDL